MRLPNFMQYARPFVEVSITDTADDSQVSIKRQGKELWKEHFKFYEYFVYSY